MLHALVQYAKDTGLSGETGFAPKTVQWLLNFSSRGEFLGVLYAGDSEERGKRGRTLAKAPHLKFSGDTPMRQFLIDTAQYALLFGEDDPDKKLLAKHKYFLSLLGEAAQVEPFLGRVADALTDKNTRIAICSALGEQQPKARSSDNVTFAEVTDAGARIIAEESTWHGWWRQRFPTLFKVKTESNQLMRCFVSGDLAEPCLTHPKIKGLAGVGGNIETTLVGFNLDAFCSYGLSQSSNAAISSQMAEQYAAALNHLLGSENNTKRLAGTIVVYWYVGDVHDDEDPLTELFAGYSFGQNEVEPSDDDVQSRKQQRHRHQAESRAAKLLDTIRSGDEDALRLRNARYCALTLSGNSGRVVVRDWMEGAFEQLVERVSLWFDCLRLQNIAGSGVINTPPIERLITCMLPDQKPGQDYAEWIKPIGPRRYLVWQCALHGPNVAMMESIARSVLLQLRSAMLRGEINEAIDENSGNRKTRLASWYARLSLLKTYCIAIGDKEVNAYLNESHPHPAYHCGRLVATCQHIQSTAIGEPKAGVLDKFYASASTSPSLVIPRIWRTSLHHLRTIRNANPSLADDLWNLLREIHAQIRDAIPLMLSLHEQSLFQLGFFHQQAFLPTEKTVKRYRTKKGILVRSKSEVIIAHLLDDLGIVYSYEEELQIDGIIQPGLLPDFTIHLGSDKPPIFIEHLGMLSRPAYKGRWEQKLCTYRQIGIDLLDSGGGPNGSLFTTTEEEIEDLAKLKARIESCLRS